MSLVRTLRILASQRPSLPSSLRRRTLAGAPCALRPRARDLDRSRLREHRDDRAPARRRLRAGRVPPDLEWLEEVARRAGTAGAMIHYRLAPRATDTAASTTRCGRWPSRDRAAPAPLGALRDSAGAGLALAVAQTLAATGVDASPRCCSSRPGQTSRARTTGRRA